MMMMMMMMMMMTMMMMMHFNIFLWENYFNTYFENKDSNRKNKHVKLLVSSAHVQSQLTWSRPHTGCAWVAKR